MNFKKLVPKKKSEEKELVSGQNFMKKNGKGKKNGHAKGNGTKIMAEEFSRARASSAAASKAKLTDLIKKEPAVAKVVRKAALLADMITDDDRAENIRVLREAKNAYFRRYDLVTKEQSLDPDFKTRLAAATLQLAYDEGTPVQRQMILTASFDSADKTLAKIKESPELLKAIQALQGVGLTIENGAGEAIDIEMEEILGNQEVAPKTETKQSS